MLIGIEWWHLRLNEARFSVDNTFYDTFKGYFNVIACFRPRLFSLCGKEQLGDFSKRLFVTDEGASCELETTFNLEYGKCTPSRVCFYMKCTVFNGILLCSAALFLAGRSSEMFLHIKSRLVALRVELTHHSARTKEGQSNRLGSD